MATPSSGVSLSWMALVTPTDEEKSTWQYRCVEEGNCLNWMPKIASSMSLNVARTCSSVACRERFCMNTELTDSKTLALSTDMLETRCYNDNERMR
eukprot:GHVU01191405.1.p1 GENE.GHVU01191405.1~~GHVU01191405.1.p1  ORF type:complete len:107 (+),score=14.83 GHVU01191405.1:34-321(+)